MTIDEAIQEVNDRNRPITLVVAIAKSLCLYYRDDKLFALKKRIHQSNAACFFWQTPNGPFIHIE